MNACSNGKYLPFELVPIAVDLLDQASMAGLRGAYAAATTKRPERIFLNQEWAETANTIELEAVLLEEIGHAIDQRLNGDNDTLGDEGAIFSALIRGVASPAV